MYFYLLLNYYKFCIIFVIILKNGYLKVSICSLLIMFLEMTIFAIVSNSNKEQSMNS